MNRFFGSKLNTVLLVALIILMVIALKVMFKNKDTYINPLFTDKTEEEINTVGMLGKKEDLVSFSIVPGAKMPNSILSYRGEIKDGWFFEGNILINILDKDNKDIIRGYLFSLFWYTFNMNIKDVENLALLTKIELSLEEKECLLSDMKGILDYVKQIESVKVGDVKAEYKLYNVWREDNVETREFSKELITKQFPDAQDGFLKVKKIL